MKPTEQYEHHYQMFSNEWRDEANDKSAELTGTYLMMFPEPKDYKGWRHFAQVLTDSITLWGVTEGFLELPEKYRASEAELAEREAKKAARQRDHIASQGSSRAHTLPQGGQYL